MTVFPDDVINYKIFWVNRILKYIDETFKFKKIKEIEKVHDKLLKAIIWNLQSINQQIKAQPVIENEYSPEGTRNRELLRGGNTILGFFDHNHHTYLEDAYFSEENKNIFFEALKNEYAALLKNEFQIENFSTLLKRISKDGKSALQNEVLDLFNQKLDQQIKILEDKNDPGQEKVYQRKGAKLFIYKACTLSEIDENIKTKTWKYIDKLLADFNMNTKDIFNPWFNIEKDLWEGDIEDHINKMSELEKARPGAVRILFNEFGITLFKKYPAELLIEQFDKRNVDMPYGIYATTHEGRENALGVEQRFSNPKLLVEKGVTLRFFEFSNPLGLIKKVATLDKRYGEKNKISFAILSAHGNTKGDKAFLGGIERKYVSSEDLTPEWIEYLKNFFTKNPRFLFISCYLGKEDQFAQTFTEINEAEVFAAHQAVNNESSEILFEEDNGIIYPRPIEKYKNMYSVYKGG